MLFHRIFFIGIAWLVSALPSNASDLTIDWEVKNRFRLFKETADFQKLAKAHLENPSILSAENKLANERADGRGWAEPIIQNERLCFDRHANALPERCERDGKSEVYLSSETHRIGVWLRNRDELGAATCVWMFKDGLRKDRTVTAKCADEIIHDAWHTRPNIVRVTVTPASGPNESAETSIKVRDILIAGLGDSIASGEGNPEIPVRLGNGGFCFRRLVGGAATSFYRPFRAGYSKDRSCTTPENPAEMEEARRQWTLLTAEWMSPACHRSIYGYQMRAALKLAIDNPLIAVTYLPLGCSGATIAHGLLGSQPAKELRCNRTAGAKCNMTVTSQFFMLDRYLRSARDYNRERELDLALLTIGANDIGFSELVADAMVDKTTTEHALLKRAKLVKNVADSKKEISGVLMKDFVRMRKELKTILGGKLDRVIFVTYGNPAKDESGKPCGTTRKGFDIHPAFGLSGNLATEAVRFVDSGFFPVLENLATCGSGGQCRDAASDTMIFSSGHQDAFSRHGLCAAGVDPDFDKSCFRDGGSFRTATNAGVDPLACRDDANLFFKPYAPRARWIRTPNDSYFTAMTYADNLKWYLKGQDIHDGIWGITSAVYGGAIHPTAEGHAAMADSVVSKAACIVGLGSKEQCADALRR